MHHTTITLLAALNFQLVLFYAIFRDFETRCLPLSLPSATDAPGSECLSELTGGISEAREP